MRSQADPKRPHHPGHHEHQLDQRKRVADADSVSDAKGRIGKARRHRPIRQEPRGVESTQGNPEVSMTVQNPGRNRSGGRRYKPNATRRELASDNRR